MSSRAIFLLIMALILLSVPPAAIKGWMLKLRIYPDAKCTALSSVNPGLHGRGIIILLHTDNRKGRGKRE